MSKLANHSLKEIGNQLMNANSILVYPHINMDGDALGSSVAICKVLRSLGKDCYVLIDEEIPRNLEFLDNGYCTKSLDTLNNVDVSLCVDSGDIDRFNLRKNKFLEGKVSICIDHHRTTVPFCDYNYVDPEAAATGEIVFKLLKEMGFSGDKEVGEAIFAAITTDTGNFQYSNTTAFSHEIMAELYGWGIETSKVSTLIYDNVRLEKLLLKSKAMGTLEFLADGQIAIASVTQKMLEETGATMDETEGIIDQIRSIGGVEIAVLVKETSQEVTKLSLRAKSFGNVAVVAEALGGGGHIKAAGGTVKMPIEEALPIIKKEVMKAVE